MARARRGEKFPELARDNSDAPSAQQGGDLQQGWKKGMLNPTLEKLVWDLPKGSVSDPVKLGNGFLILKVEEHHKAGLADFEEVQSDISEKLYLPRFQPKAREFMTRLRQEAFLEIRDGFIDTGAAAGKDTRWQDPAQLKPETTTKAEVEAKVRKKRLLWMVPVGVDDGTRQSRSQPGK
ncbi:MAG: peptidylprolyl isomerase [Acidobacteria bacterium]|nr:peptidylprolyl isomerase [Acidobacteriota bacterium]